MPDTITIPQMPQGLGPTSNGSLTLGPTALNSTNTIATAIPSATQNVNLSLQQGQQYMPGITNQFTLGNIPGIANNTQAMLGAAGPAGSSTFSNSDDQEGEDLYTAVAKLAPFANMGSIPMNNGDTLKIACYLVNKALINEESTIYFKYGTDIKNISITDSVTKFGTTASIDIIDNGGGLTTLLQYQMSYYFVISILNVIDDGTDKMENTENKIEQGIFYQPYIFELDFVETISSDRSKSKIYRLYLSDIISSTLKKVSYGNLLLEYTAFPNCSNFGDVYRYFIDYAALIINLTHNKKYKIPKTLMLGGSINDNLNTIIKDVILKDVTIDTPLYDLLNKFYSTASRELEVPEHFAAKAEVKGMVSVPLLLNEEWEDLSATYRRYYNDHDSDSMVETLSLEGSVTVNSQLFKRGLYLKHLQMPFQLLFGDKPKVYEIINPKYSEGMIDESEVDFNPMNGFTNSPVDDMVEIPIDQYTSAVAWKNLALMSDGAQGAANALIYWNWIFEYYKNVYLNYENNIIKKKYNKETLPPANPHFNIVDKLNLVGGDKDTFAKINAVTIRMRSMDPIKEALWHVGRSVKSYIFMNDLYGFKIKGNIIRHPGEIIKINAPNKNDAEADSVSSIAGGINTLSAGYTLSYITQITHSFNGTRYEDIIYATKICNIDDIIEEKAEIPTTGDGVPTNKSASETATGANNNQQQQSQ